MSADPSSRLSGREMKLFPPASAFSQNPSKRYEGSAAGAFDEPERLTPRNSRVRPCESTKLPSTVCTKIGGGRSPVAGEIAGIFGMFATLPGWRGDEREQRKERPFLEGATRAIVVRPGIIIRVRVCPYCCHSVVTPTPTLGRLGCPTG